MIVNTEVLEGRRYLPKCGQSDRAIEVVGSVSERGEEDFDLFASTSRSSTLPRVPPYGFSLKFTQVLDILQAVLKNQDTKFLVLTGSTPVDVRQTLVDEFTDDDSIPVFLLSTKAGGMGINLTAASSRGTTFLMM